MKVWGMDRWMDDGCMDGEMEGEMDGWMDGWVCSRPAWLCSESLFSKLFVVNFCQPPKRRSKHDSSEVLKLKKVTATSPHSGPPLRQGAGDMALSPFPQLDGTLSVGSRGGSLKVHGWAVGQHQSGQPKG